ncbi:MAG: transglycosylase [Novosphingobium sp. 63-713]|uniref:lytic transglycosylase domain-containing protein n=1 Tax=unclassified Novosphingobium TaxID=2644732 RepID=UPI000963501F|nr:MULTISPECIES: lytic transglycosylase domain-containing protein [unclassified Novosphingobium]MBN9142372.1 lytic transglycosylase domain-containing protein [Novosphingobium sp.]OJX97640.1 MAG: transglycosylase [Novosphingobium sp. 63-713]
MIPSHLPLSIHLLLIWALFAPQSAWADVLQVDGGASRWVVGAPAYARQPEAKPSSADHQAETVDYGSSRLAPETWKGYLSAIAARYNLDPALLEALVWQESRWRTNAISPVGARGLTQLMPATARQMGVDANDPISNLEGGARYLRLQLNAFNGDLVKALAAYNAGPKRVQDAGGVPRIRETQEYVASILGRLTVTLGR